MILADIFTALETVASAALWLVALAALVAVLGAVIAGISAHRQPIVAGTDPASVARRAEMRAYAEERGWQFIGRDDTFTDRWAAFANPRHDTVFQWQHPIPKTGAGKRRCENIILGTHHGHPFVAFDVMVIPLSHASTYMRGSMRTRTPRNGTGSVNEVDCYSVVALSTGVALPLIIVRPETSTERAFGALLNTDQRLESEDFNRKFIVNTNDRKFASDILDPRMMQTLLDGEPQPWETLGPDLSSTRQNDPATPATLMGRIEHLDRVLHHIPDHVWTTVGHTPPAYEQP